MLVSGSVVDNCTVSMRWHSLSVIVLLTSIICSCLLASSDQGDHRNHWIIIIIIILPIEKKRHCHHHRSRLKKTTSQLLLHQPSSGITSPAASAGPDSSVALAPAPARRHRPALRAPSVSCGRRGGVRPGWVTPMDTVQLAWHIQADRIHGIRTVYLPIHE